MISEVTTVHEYIEQAPEKRREALTKLRTLCKKILVGYTENMQSTGPTYKKDKGAEIVFSSQKTHICFYCLVHEVMLDHEKDLQGFNHGKGVIRFSNAAKINYALISKILEATVASDKKPC